MILSDRTMLEIHGITIGEPTQWQGHSPIIIPYDPDLQQPASYDLLLGDVRDENGYVMKLTNDTWAIKTHQFVLGSTLELIQVPNNMVARIEGKSSLARQGIMVHTAGFIDPGFTGQLTLEIVNHGPLFILRRGQRIAQLAVQLMDGPALYPYGHPRLGSHYQGQSGPTPAHESTYER